MVTLPSASVFFLKIHLFSIARRSSGKSVKVHTLFSYMDSISDFMASSHLLESGPAIASNKWLEAMQSEIGSMYENKLWTLTDLPVDQRAIENKWIFNKKTDADGNVTIYKARLVAKGYRQVQGVDYDETFSPVAKLKSV